MVVTKSLHIEPIKTYRNKEKQEFTCPDIDGLTELEIKDIDMNNIPKSVKIIKMLSSNISDGNESKRTLDLDDLVEMHYRCKDLKAH